jgi:ribosomal protein L14
MTIIAGTMVTAVDNVYEVRTIRGGTQGDRMLGVIHKVKKPGEWKKGDLVRGLIVRTRKAEDRAKGLRVLTGIKVGFPQENSIVILGGKGQGVGGEVGPLTAISVIVKTKGFAKVLAKAWM